MTLTADELRRERAVADWLIAWRTWRRSMHLTVAEAAAMADVDAAWLQRLETGKARVRTPGQVHARLAALMARWPEDRRP